MSIVSRGTPVEGTASTIHEKIYLLCAGIFIGALVISNVIAAKFFVFKFLGVTVSYSVGIFAYPVTFLVTDIVSEIYGKKRADAIVLVGFVVSLFSLGVITLGYAAPTYEKSPLSQESYAAVFKYAPRFIFASMVAYLVAQIIDIRVFHFWKNLTGGRHLWLRNNGSTVFSQLVDTTLVVVLTFAFTETSSGEVIAVGEMAARIRDGYLIKALVALLDTPLFYLAVFIFQKKLPSVEALGPSA